jgi:hypothetical protein
MDFATISARRVTFQSTQQQSKGITKVIRKLFFPGYSHHKLRGSRPSNVGGLSYRQARNRGKLLDKQLQLCIGREVSRPPPRAIRETIAILSYIAKRGYYIETAQQRVGYAPWRLATALDLVLRPLVPSAQDHRVVVEVKRGCIYRNMLVPNQTSKGLMPSVPVSPLFMHELQVILGAQLLLASDASLPIDSLWVLYANDSGVECHESSDFTVQWTKTTEEYLEATAACLSNGKRKKKRTMVNLSK